MQRDGMAQVAFGLVEHLLPAFHRRIVHVAAGRYTKALHVQVHILHFFRADVQLVVCQSHHASVLHLELSFADLFRIAAVRDAQVTAEAKFHGQVGMLCFVAAQP